MLPLLRDDHPDSHIHDSFFDWEQPEVSRNYLIDEVNLDRPLASIETSNILPVLPVTTAIVVIISHRLTVNPLYELGGYRAPVPPSTNGEGSGETHSRRFGGSLTKTTGYSDYGSLIIKHLFDVESLDYRAARFSDDLSSPLEHHVVELHSRKGVPSHLLLKLVLWEHNLDSVSVCRTEHYRVNHEVRSFLNHLLDT